MKKIKKWCKNIKKILNNIILCIRFPFLYPRNVYTDKHYTNWKIANWVKKNTNKAKINFHVVEKESSEIVNSEIDKTYATISNVYTHVLDHFNTTLSVMLKDNNKKICIYNTLNGKHCNEYDISNYVKNYSDIHDVCFLTKTVNYKNVTHTKLTSYDICLVVPKKEENTFYSLFPQIIVNKPLNILINFVKWFDNNILQLFHCLPKYTYLDAIDIGWRKKFGIEMCKEIRKDLIKCGWKYLFTYRLMQVKEKWGELCWYDSYIPKGSKIFDITQKYANLSLHTCIDCGEEAIWRTKGYILPYCDKCVDKLNHFKKPIREYGLTKNPYSSYWSKEELKKEEENET